MTTRVAPSPIFGRRADGNLEVDVPITLAEAIGGANIEVPTLRGTKRIRVAPGTEHGSIQRLRGEGPPKPNTRDRGDIHYRLEIQIPKDLDRKQREAVDELSRSLDGADAARADPPRRPARERGILRARRGSVRRLGQGGYSVSGASGDSKRNVVRKTTVVETQIDRDRGVFMISVAAELAEMHPQTLRMYEARGLIQPKRSPKNTRLYSHEDVERLRRIQAMTAEQGLNLAGVETVLELESNLDELRSELRAMRERTAEMEQRMTEEIERARRSLGAELVPYGVYEPSLTGDSPVRIAVERRGDAPRG